MKDIKFRAWDKGEKRFWYFTLQQILERRMSYRGSWDGKILLGEKTQYTGLSDKNDKEIYEGDSDGNYVVKFGTFLIYNWEDGLSIEEVTGWYLEPLPKTKEVVPYNIALNEHFIQRGVCIDGMVYYSQPFKKNIYENPELLGDTNA